jgi:hypothetical protein
MGSLWWCRRQGSRGVPRPDFGSRLRRDDQFQGLGQAESGDNGRPCGHDCAGGRQRTGYSLHCDTRFRREFMIAALRHMPWHNCRTAIRVPLSLSAFGRTDVKRPIIGVIL